MKNSIMKLGKCTIVCMMIVAMAFSYLTPGAIADAKKKIKVSSVSVTNASGNKLSLAVGQTKKLNTKVVVSPSKKAYKKVAYKSLKKSVATVSSSGKVTAKKAGKAKITVTSRKDKSKKATITVTVTAVKVTSITLDETDLTIEESNEDGEEIQATVNPDNASNDALEWSTSNEDVADVDPDDDADGETCTIVPTAVGTCTITAKATDGSGVTATCKVTVTASEDDGE